MAKPKQTRAETEDLLLLQQEKIKLSESQKLKCSNNKIKLKTTKDIVKVQDFTLNRCKKLLTLQKRKKCANTESFNLYKNRKKYITKDSLSEDNCPRKDLSVNGFLETKLITVQNEREVKLKYLKTESPFCENLNSDDVHNIIKTETEKSKACVDSNFIEKKLGIIEKQTTNTDKRTFDDLLTINVKEEPHESNQVDNEKETDACMNPKPKKVDVSSKTDKQDTYIGHTCEECNIHFVWPESLQCHMDAVHNNQTVAIAFKRGNSKQDIQSTGIIKCSVNIPRLDIIDGGVMPRKCENIVYVKPNQDKDYLNHTSVCVERSKHMSDYGYQCVACDKHFSTQQSLWTHMKVFHSNQETSNKKSDCKACKLTCKQSSVFQCNQETVKMGCKASGHSCKLITCVKRAPVVTYGKQAPVISVPWEKDCTDNPDSGQNNVITVIKPKKARTSVVNMKPEQCEESNVAINSQTLWSHMVHSDRTVIEEEVSGAAVLWKEDTADRHVLQTNNEIFVIHTNKPPATVNNVSLTLCDKKNTSLRLPEFDNSTKLMTDEIQLNMTENIEERDFVAIKEEPKEYQATGFDRVYHSTSGVNDSKNVDKHNFVSVKEELVEYD